MCLVFETHLEHCVVSLSKTVYPLFRTGPTQEDIPKILLLECKASIQKVTKQNFFVCTGQSRYYSLRNYMSTLIA